MAGECWKTPRARQGSGLDGFPRILEITEQTGLQPCMPMDAAELRHYATTEALVPKLGRNFNSIPLSQEWFQAIEEQRHGRHGAWLPRHLEFDRHEREQVLCLGACLGTDWVNYAINGAKVSVAAETRLLEPILLNFRWRGLSANTFPTDSGTIPLPDESADVIAANWMLDDEAPSRWASEVTRLLKPGGKILALVRAQWNLRKIMRLRWWVPESAWTRAGLARLLPEFEEIRVRQRQLRRAEVPGILRFIPMPLLERLAGNALILKAFKPLSAREETRIAA